jgi:hypothetical protein
VAALAVLAAVLNWVSTGDHLLKTIGAGYWPVAGVDLMLLAAAAFAVVAALKLRRRARQHSPAQIGEDDEDADAPQAARA